MKKICCIVNPVSGLKKSLKVYYEAKIILKNLTLIHRYLFQNIQIT